MNVLKDRLRHEYMCNEVCLCGVCAVVCVVVSLPSGLSEAAPGFGVFGQCSVLEDRPRAAGWPHSV